MEDLWGLRYMDTLMKQILEDIAHWEDYGKFPIDEFFEHDIAFIKEMLRATTIASKNKMTLEELLKPPHHLASTIVLSTSMNSEDFPHLIQKTIPVDEATKKSDPLWSVQFFTNYELDLSDVREVRELRMRIAEADKITDHNAVHEFIKQYASNVISSRIEGDFLKRSLKHPSLRKFFEECFESFVLDNPEEDSYMVKFQLDYADARLHILTDGANYSIPTLPLAPHFTNLDELLGWLKVAKQKSDARMSENRKLRLSREDNPYYPYAVMDSEDVSLMKRNPFYSFKWFVEGFEIPPQDYFLFPTDDQFPDYTYNISQLAYRVHTKSLVLNIPEISDIHSTQMVEAIEANIEAFRLAVQQGHVSSELSVETYVKDPISGPFEETFQYLVADETSASNGEFWFSCDKIGFGEDHNTRVILEVEEVYPHKTFSELVDMVNSLITLQIEDQK